MLTKKVVLSLSLLLGLMLLAGCPQHKSIADIMKDPAYYANREVTVAGTVTRSYGALGTGVYEVDDGTGKMWVFAERTGVPSQGSRVASVGKVMPTLSFAGVSYATVLRERERKH
ncbi:MAG TPA: hypothetical protein VMZ25_02155 [Terriglobales bacterium]|nr:hypothetical protein [Terriglobales bacterium]